MNPSFIIPADAKTARETCARRGFASMKEWAKANREGQAVNRQRKRPELVAALETEYAKFIRPNL